MLALATDCKSKPPPMPETAVMGEIAARDDVDFAPYLAAARAVVMHTEKPEAPPPSAKPSQRAFVTLFAPAQDPAVGTGRGDTLYASVVAAAEDVAKRAPPSSRIEIDVVTSAEPIALETGAREETWRLGTRGFLVASGPDHVGFISPSEVYAQKYFDMSGEKDGSVPLAADRLLTTLAARAGIDRKQLPTVYAVTTTARLDSNPTGRAVPLMRGWPMPKRDPLGPPDLMEATRAGADYLARVIDARGHYQYTVKVVEPNPDRSYGWLRHAGTTYALLEAFAELGDPRWLEKARLALAAIKTKMRLVPDVGAYLRDNNDEEQQKVGGGGLAIIAFAKFAELTAERDHYPAMTALADLIVKQQYSDGHFRNNADVEHEDPSQKGTLKTEVMYYPGEGMLGLMRAYALEPKPQYLEAAKRAAQWMIDIRDQGKDEEHILPDHWGCYALNDLYRVTKNPEYAEHAFKIARGILKAETTAEKAKTPDFAATFYAHGESTPTATRLEAVAAVMELSRAAGKDTAWLDAAAQRYASFLRSQQYDADSVYYTRDPKFMLGGVRESLVVSDIRIDYVQHAMSGWIHLAKLIRDPKWGTLTASTDAGAPK
jgi:hypothetical protein